MRRISMLGVLRWSGLVIAGTVLICWASMLLAGRVVAAEATADAAKADRGGAGGAAAASQEEKTAGAKTKTRKAAKPRGRLPNYFAGVVSDEQREKIYAIQKEFEPKISQLRRDLETLTAARDQKIHALLTPEQKKKIDDLKAAAKQSREKKEAAESGPEAKQETRKKPAKGDGAAKPAAPAPKPDAAGATK